MEGKKHKNTLLWYKQNLLETLKRRLKRVKLPLKSRFLGSKSVQLGMKNYEPTTKLERLKWCKMLVMFSKTDTLEDVKSKKQ